MIPLLLGLALASFFIGHRHGQLTEQKRIAQEMAELDAVPFVTAHALDKGSSISFPA